MAACWLSRWGVLCTTAGRFLPGVSCNLSACAGASVSPRGSMADLQLIVILRWSCRCQWP